MQYRRLGRSGLKVSALCLGTMQFGWTADEVDAHAVLDAFVGAGGSFIDTANIYSNWAPGNPGGVSEAIIGRWLRERGNRHELVLATKARGRMWPGANGEGLSRAHLIRACDESLARLQTDYIDLFQLHWFDAETPIEETLGALTDLIRAGKVRYVGCSNFPAWRLVEALWTSEHYGLARFESLQPHYNLAHRDEFEAELAAACAQYGVGVIPYSPLAGGFLTGKYRRDEEPPASDRADSVARRYFNERGWRTVEALRAVAEELRARPGAVAVAWLLSRPGVTAPIVGANSPVQLEESLGALEIELSAEQRARLDEASAPPAG